MILHQQTEKQCLHLQAPNTFIPKTWITFAYLRHDFSRLISEEVRIARHLANLTPQGLISICTIAFHTSETGYFSRPSLNPPQFRRMCILQTSSEQHVTMCILYMPYKNAPLLCRCVNRLSSLRPSQIHCLPRLSLSSETYQHHCISL